MDFLVSNIGGKMKKENNILRTLVAWLLIFLVCLDIVAVIMIIDILQYSVLITIPLLIVIVAFTVSLNVALIVMLIETKNEWK